MNPDLSYQERQFQKGLRQELVRRKSTGKTSIVICNGQIVKLVQRDTSMTGHPPSTATDRVNRSLASAPHQSSWYAIFFLWWFGEIKIFYTNIDQFLNKKDEFEMAIAGDEPDIIFINL